MSQPLPRTFSILTLEAIRDAIRRRIVAVVAGISLLSLMLIDRCTSFRAGTMTLNDAELDPLNVEGWTSSITFGVLGLWVIVLAGVLAAEHLAHTLTDGSAVHTLSRPVGRSTFALARLTGALIIALATGVLLLGGTAFFVYTRYELPLGPAALAGLLCALAAIATGALAMSVSLYLPHIASVLLIFAYVGTVTLANGISLLAGEPSGILGVVDRYGPPLCTAMAFALSPWIQPLGPEPATGAVALRLFLWAGGGLLLLRFVFQRVELRG